MKQDIDRLMREAGLDGLLVMGPGQHNPYLTYLVGLAHLTDALVVKRLDAEPVLVHRSMERGEAERSGMERLTFESFGWLSHLESAEGDLLKAKALRAADIINACGMKGRVALYGRLDLAESHPLIHHLHRALPDLEWGVEPEGGTVLDRARVTKDAQEIAHIRHMGEVTTDVATATSEYLSQQRAADGVLVDEAGRPITVGQVKSRIRRMMVERGADLPNGMILSVGRDTALPHSVGEDDQPVPIGRTIILDLYPAQMGGGYFYDFTRTWVLGSADPETQALYDDVSNIYDQFAAGFRVGEATHTYQVEVSRAFEAMGHASLLSDEKTQSGFVHGLGHGIGLSIHEPPAFRINGEGSLPLAPGMVFTFEPGLYYPDRGIGVRIEDTLVVEEDGSIHPIVDYPKELILPVSGA